MDTSIILQQLQDKLLKKYDKLKVDLSEEELEEMLGPGFNTQSYLSFDNTADLDDEPEAVNTPYVTHRPFALPRGTKRGNVLPVGEAESDIDTEHEAGAVADKALAAAGEETQATVDDATNTDMGGDDMNMGDVGGMGGMDNMDSAGMMGGLGEQEEEKTPTELGRIYELKKIYARLTSIESYLGNESDQELLEIRNYVSQSIELFEIVSSNFNSYKDRLNEVIVMYYKFLLEVYSSVKSYYAKQKKLGDK